MLETSKRTGAMSRSKANKSKSSSGGFGKNEAENEVKETIISEDGCIYSRPALYDLAFGYRNYEEEVRFLIESHQKYSDPTDSGRDESVPHLNLMEIAAGPARHSITALRNFGSSVNSCTAVDLSTDMINYSKEVADEELGDAGIGGKRDSFNYIQSDMRDIQSIKKESIDAGWILLGSMQHLTTNDDVISCFQSISKLLRKGGTLTLELPHPRETFSMVECTRNGWEVPLEDENGEYGELKIVWGDENDVFDPIRQVRDFTISMQLESKDDSIKHDADMQSVKEVVPMRLFTAQEIDALGRIAGFEVKGLYGALSEEVDISSDDEAFRLVCILRKA